MGQRPTERQARGAATRRGACLARWAAAALFLGLAIARTWDVGGRFWMLGDQIRDWGIALGSFTDLPLVGPVAHVGGYPLGPAFYWVLWVIRVTIGPWFDNLPHAGGIGSALLQSGVDALLLVAIWRRTGSGWLSLAAVLLVATAPYDLALSVAVWNPVMASVLAKAAIALVLLGWPERSSARAAVTASVAWGAFQCHMPALFPALGVMAAIVAPPLVERRRRAAVRRALVVFIVVLVMQAPYVAHRIWRDPGGGGAVSVVDSLGRIATGQSPVRFGWSADLFARAIALIQIRPWDAAWLGWLVVPGAVIVTVRHRRDPALLAVTVAPLAVTLVGYAFWLGASDSYYYLSVMPAAVLAVLLGATAYGPSRWRRGVAMALCAVALLVVPARLREAQGIHRMPEYAAILRASRQMAARGVALRRIEAGFLPPTSEPDFLYRILGGRLAPEADWTATVSLDGDVVYTRAR